MTAPIHGETGRPETVPRGDLEFGKGRCFDKEAVHQLRAFGRACLT